jgi:hypothetical protein
VEGTAKGDHTRTASGSAGYLDGVFDGFGAGAEKGGFLGEVAGVSWFSFSATLT